MNSKLKENQNINKFFLTESEFFEENNSELKTYPQSLEDAIHALSDINKRLESYLHCKYKE